MEDIAGPPNVFRPLTVEQSQLKVRFRKIRIERNRLLEVFHGQVKAIQSHMAESEQMPCIGVLRIYLDSLLGEGLGLQELVFPQVSEGQKKSSLRRIGVSFQVVFEKLDGPGVLVDPKIEQGEGQFVDVGGVGI